MIGVINGLLSVDEVRVPLYSAFHCPCAWILKQGQDFKRTDLNLKISVSGQSMWRNGDIWWASGGRGQHSHTSSQGTCGVLSTGTVVWINSIMAEGLQRLAKPLQAPPPPSPPPPHTLILTFSQKLIKRFKLYSLCQTSLHGLSCSVVDCWKKSNTWWNKQYRVALEWFSSVWNKSKRTKRGPCFCNFDLLDAITWETCVSSYWTLRQVYLPSCFVLAAEKYAF